jgi:phosphoribosylaminoimidazolecarboxamide formyltransferase/IMP cyclohydrolase
MMFLLFQEENSMQIILTLLKEKKGHTSVSDRRFYAAKAFQTSSHYDTAIFNYFNREASIPAFRESINLSYPLRYGENPHQKGIFYGDTESDFRKTSRERDIIQ